MTEAQETPVPVAESLAPPGSLAAKLGKKRSRRLGSIGNVKSALAFVCRELEADTMDTGKARALVYALQTLAGLIVASDLEERVRRLEAGR